MPDPIRTAPPKRGLAAIVGCAAAACLYVVTPAQEGRVLKTYRDVGAVLTYCDGATENAVWGKAYTPADCNAQLDRDLARHAEGMMACTHPPTPLTDGQKVAYTDFAYNVGVANYCGSTVARKANAGDVRGSCDALPVWSCITVGEGKGDKYGVCASKKASHKFVQGLANRRAVERNICLKGIV